MARLLTPKKIAAFLLVFSLILCFFCWPTVIRADGHDGFVCFGGSKMCAKSRQIIAQDWHICCQNGKCKSCLNDSFQCDPWQKCEATANDVKCYCSADCLDYPKNARYYDNPDYQAGRTAITRKDPNDPSLTIINLPVALVWDNITGWAALSQTSQVEASKNMRLGRIALSSGCQRVSGFRDKGPKSYIIEIQDDPATPNSNGISNMNIPAGAKTVTADGRKAFQKRLQINQFNSRADGGECFFNTNSKYRWRVYACCNSDGADTSDCSAANSATWWSFTTSPAPEPLYPYDPDWNGPKAVGDAATPLYPYDPDGSGPMKAGDFVNFCKAKLEWCKAKLPKDQITYTASKLYYSADYQLRIKSSENESILSAIGASSGASSGWGIMDIVNGIGNFLGNLKQKYLNGPINEFMAEIQGKSAEELKESCHYLQEVKDKTNKDAVIGCRPNPITFTVGEAKLADFRPYLSSEIKSADHATFFSGDLVYAWQTKTCLGVKAPNNPDYCYDDESSPRFNYSKAEFAKEEKLYGQKWKFKTTSMQGIEPPPLKLPPDNQKFNDLDANKNSTTNDLVEFETDKLKWDIPCGANSFVYDVQKIDQNGTSKSIFPDSEIMADGGRRLKSGIEVLVKLPDNNNNTAPNLETITADRIKLELDTAYQWRVKSCWPSNPLGDTKSGAKTICRDKWSPWFHFRTTGRPPAQNSLQVKDVAPEASLSWEAVDGARSYRLKIIGGPADEIVVEKNEYVFSYPQPLKSYTWLVRTCADRAGTICGNKSSSASFNSGDFAKPVNLNPSGNVKQLPYSMTWSSSARYFLVNATFIGEKSTSCDPDWFNIEYKDKVVSGTSLILKTKSSGGSQYCAGNYHFKVQPCFKNDCDTNTASRSKRYGESSFLLTDPDQKNTGLMVCGQRVDDSTTDYNEKEPCAIKHIILTIKVIINFILFKVAFWLLPILLGITGYFFYTSKGNPKIVGTMKETWQKIGIGYAIIFFAWFIVAVLMQITGYSATTSWSVL